MKQPLFFRIYKNGQLVEIKQLQTEQAVIGTNDDTEVPLKDENVSPIHAMVEERESGFFICDLGSTGGTFKNGEKVLDAPISSGDEIKVGPFTIEFYVGVPKPKSKPPRVGATAAAPPSAPQRDEVYDKQPAKMPEKTPEKTPEKVAPQKPVEQKPVERTVTAAKPTEKEIPPAEDSAKIELESFKKDKKEIKADVGSNLRAQKENPPVSVQAKSSSFQKVEAAKTPAKSRPAGGGLEVHNKIPNRTYAPPSAYKDLRQVLKPTKGTVVEIILAWKERIISTHHFSEKGTIHIGSHPDNDIILPIFGSAKVRHPLLKLEGAAKIFLTSDLKGELIQGDSTVSFSEAQRKGRTEAAGAGYYITLQQGELVKVDFGDSISIYVRYVNQAPKPLAAPFLDLSTLEMSSMVGILIFGAIMWLYMAVYQATPPIEEVKTEEPPRRAVFLYKPQIDPIDMTQAEAPPTDKAKLADKKTPEQVKAPTKAPTPQKAASKDDEGKASEAKPNNSKSNVVKLTAPNAGKSTGIQKAAVAAKNNKSDAQGGSQQKDVTKMGIMSVLSGKGAQDSLSKAYSGAGVVGGLSQNATGTGGQSAVGAGDTPGEGLKDIGKGGKGEATVGISGVNTKGRGGGLTGYGTGSIGDKKNATVIPGGAEESFTGTIDREAIRRVIVEHMREIKACYDRALNRDPGLHGKVVLSWVIGDRGRVKTAGVGSTTMNSSEVEQCMVSRLRTWIFPEPPVGQEAEVTYPFVFTAQN